MPIAIETKFLGPTNYRGSRIVATTCNGHRLVCSYDHALHADDAHDGAAIALCHKLGWHGTLVRGGTKTGNVYVWLHIGYSDIRVTQHYIAVEPSTTSNDTTSHELATAAKASE